MAWQTASNLVSSGRLASARTAPAGISCRPLRVSTIVRSEGGDDGRMSSSGPGSSTSPASGERKSKIGIKGGIDGILDFALAGPKMRKWYNEEEDEGLQAVKGRGREREGGTGGEDEAEPTTRDGILVIGAETALGDAVLMQLILQRQPNVTAHVKSVERVRTQYAEYVRPMSVSLDSGAMGKALRGTRVVICCGPVANLPASAKAAVVEHLVCVDVEQRSSGPFGLGGSEDAQLEPAIPKACVASGVPTTVVRVKQISGRPTVNALSFSLDGEPQGAVSREDVALAAVQCALGKAPPGARQLSLSFAGSGVADWGQLEALLA